MLQGLQRIIGNSVLFIYGRLVRRPVIGYLNRPEMASNRLRNTSIYYKYPLLQLKSSGGPCQYFSFVQITISDYVIYRFRCQCQSRKRMSAFWRHNFVSLPHTLLESSASSRQKTLQILFCIAPAHSKQSLINNDGHCTYVVSFII